MAKILKKIGQKAEKWTFETLKDKLFNEMPIVDNENGTWTIFTDGGENILLDEQEDITYE